MAKSKNPERIDPTWPEDLPDGVHPVSEVVSPLQGASSPFGEIEFPVEDVPYVHPETVINR